jgi:hypothetical protein
LFPRGTALLLKEVQLDGCRIGLDRIDGRHDSAVFIAIYRQLDQFMGVVRSLQRCHIMADGGKRE